MKHNPLVPFLLILLGVSLDMVAGPMIFGRWVGLHCTGAAVALIGLRRGRWWGLGVGWVGGILLGSLSTAPLGLWMLSLGLMGFAAGLLQRFAQINVPLLDALLVLALLALEDTCAGLTAWALLGVRWHPGFLGVGLTVLLLLLFSGRRRGLSRVA